MSDKEMEPIPAGSLVNITTGEYSNYSIHGVFRANVELNPNALRAEFLNAHPEAKTTYGFSLTKFLGYLIQKQMLEPIESFEWGFGDFDMNVSYYEASNE